MEAVGCGWRKRKLVIGLDWSREPSAGIACGRCRKRFGRESLSRFDNRLVRVQGHGEPGHAE